MDESEVAGASLMSAISSNMVSSPRGIVRVKPYPDPKRPQETEYMKQQELKEETMLPSRHWVESGTGNLGRLYLEILSCHDLPNTDIGSTVGNLSDAFCCAIYEDSLVETDVIDDELSPHWLPWTQRAFAFNIMHPSSVLFLAVFGYKRRMLNHTPIGRVEINLGNMQRDTVYNMQYSLFRSSHVIDRTVRATCIVFLCYLQSLTYSQSCGTIKVRLRMEIKNERAFLMASLRPPPPIYLNVEKQKSWPVMRYACRGEVRRYR